MSTIASEAGHYYYSQAGEWGSAGTPCFQITGKNGKVRAPNIGDIKRGLLIYPSVTTIMREAAKPGLEAWKAKQILEAALTLPRQDGESLDDYAKRVVEDSKAQSQKARDKGTSLHAAIEDYASGRQMTPTQEWRGHVLAVEETLMAQNIALCATAGNTEHSFASPLGYGGKIDWNNRDSRIVLDFKSKDKLPVPGASNIRLVYDEHPMQLSAYGNALFEGQFRAFSVFVGCEDKQVRVIEHAWDDLQRGWGMFQCLLAYWKIKSKV